MNRMHQKICMGWVLLSLVLVCPNSFAQKQTEVLFETDTLYHHVTILDKNQTGRRVRCMRFSGRTPTNQSCIDLDDPNRQVLEYSGMTFGSLLLSDSPGKVLVIGLGGGVIPTVLNDVLPKTKVDVAEIDGQVYSLAKKYFSLKVRNGDSVTIEDGRRFVKKSKLKYNMVVLDAFNGDQIPFHLMTLEFFELLKSKAMASNGVLVSNVFFSSELFNRQLATYHKAFKNVYTLRGDRSGNVVILATNAGEKKSKDELITIARALQEKNHYKQFDLVKLTGLLSDELTPEPGAKILTDDYAPVNYLQKQK